MLLIKSWPYKKEATVRTVEQEAALKIRSMTWQIVKKCEYLLNEKVELFLKL